MMFEMPRCMERGSSLAQAASWYVGVVMQQHTLWAAPQMLSLNSDAER
jgi:hypothetical protein